MKPQLITLALLALGPLCGLGQGAMGITDTATGFYWLPLTATTNIAENQVLSLYPAYEISSQSQVLQLWADCGIHGNGGGIFGSPVTDWHPLFKFMDAMGVTYKNEGNPGALGHCADGGLAGIEPIFFNGVLMYGLDLGSTWHNGNYAFDGIGTYIYTAVPEPSIFALCLVGLLTLTIANHESQHCH